MENLEFTGAKSFIMIPVGIARDQDLLKQPKAILLMGEIYTMLNITGKFYMSNSKLADRLDCSARAVQKYLTLLENKGLIKRDIVKDPDSNAVKGRMIASGPTLVKYSSQGWGTPVREGSEHQFTGVTNGCSPKYINIIDQHNRESNIYSSTGVEQDIPEPKNESVKKNSDKEAEAEFKELWRDYPKKQGKKQALKHYIAWKKLSKENTLDKVKQQLDNYKKYVYSQRNRGFNLQWKNGSTWFNGGIDDDYSVTQDQDQAELDSGFKTNVRPMNILDDELPF